jgi:hypothetical protein
MGSLQELAGIACGVVKHLTAALLRTFSQFAPRGLRHEISFFPPSATLRMPPGSFWWPECYLQSIFTDSSSFHSRLDRDYNEEARTSHVVLCQFPKTFDW